MRRAMEARLSRLRTCTPAVVTAYDADTQKVSCKPLIKQAFVDEEDARQTEKLPVTPNCPVSFPGDKTFRLTLPISDGTLKIDGATVPATTGVLFFSDRSMDAWLSGNGDEVDPEVDHMHSLMDGIFVPGINPFGAPLGDCPTDHATFGHDSGVQLHSHKDVMTVAKKDDESGAKAVTIDGDSAGWLVWTPNVPPAGAASLVYSTVDPGVIPAPAVKMSLVVKAGATQFKAK